MRREAVEDESGECAKVSMRAKVVTQAAALVLEAACSSDDSVDLGLDLVQEVSLASAHPAVSLEAAMAAGGREVAHAPVLKARNVYVAAPEATPFFFPLAVRSDRVLRC